MLTKVIILLSVVGSAWLHHCSQADLDKSVAIIQVHVTQTYEPKTYDVLCAGVVLDQKFILTNARCLSKINKDHSNIVGIKLATDSEVFKSDIVKAIRMPKNADPDVKDTVGVIELTIKLNAPKVIRLGNNPSLTQDPQLSVYQFTHADLTNGATLSDVTIESVKLTGENVKETRDGVIGLQKLPRALDKTTEVWGAPLLSHDSVIGVYSSTNVLADAPFDGNTYLFVEVNQEKDFFSTPIA